MLLIGSRALQLRAPHILNRNPKDFDFICSEDEAIDFCKNHNLVESERVKNKIIVMGDSPLEFEIDNTESAKMLTDIVKSDKRTVSTSFGMIPTLNLLFALKSSHKYLRNSPHFWKTARDYHVMKKIGCTVEPEHMEFFKVREKETYNYSHPNLNVKKSEFFNMEEVKYTYDHDTIHEAMAIKEKPAYTYYQKDGSEVLCDKEKFFALPEEYRINGVLEESYVLALERSQIPHPGVMTPKQSFMLALSKVCSSITSGYFRTFAFDNVFKIASKYDDTYLDRFNLALKNGIVKEI